MKKISEKLKLVLMFVVLLIPVFTIDASAASYTRSSSFSRTPLGTVLSVLGPVLAVVAVIVVKLSDKSFEKRRKNSQFFSDDTEHFFYNSADSINMTSGGANVFDPRLSDGENIMLKQFENQAKMRHPDPVSTQCPNCGAPLSISDKTVCPYCRSNVVNQTVFNNNYDDKPKPISPEYYNPTRYYDENVTGYESRSIDGSVDNQNNNDNGFFYNSDNYRQTNDYYDDNYANRNYNGYYKGQKYSGDNNRW